MSRKCEGPDQLRVLIEVFVVHLLFQHFVQIDLHIHIGNVDACIYGCRDLYEYLYVYIHTVHWYWNYTCVCVYLFIYYQYVYSLYVYVRVCVCRRVCTNIFLDGAVSAHRYSACKCVQKGWAVWNTWESSRFGIVKALKAFNSFILLLLLPANPLADNVTHGWSANGCHGWISLNRCQKDFKHMYTFAAFLLPINHNKSCSHWDIQTIL